MQKAQGFLAPVLDAAPASKRTWPLSRWRLFCAALTAAACEAGEPELFCDIRWSYSGNSQWRLSEGRKTYCGFL